MNVLIRAAKIIDPSSAFNGTIKDVLIKNGIISEIKSSIEASADVQVIAFENLHLSPGWFDMNCNLGDPGLEYKEDLISGAAAAAYGGFTGVACMPATEPSLSSKSEIQYIINKAKDLLVDVHPIGSLSSKLEGKEISEMYDMHLAGAVAFSDGKKSIGNSGLLSRAMLYAKGFDGLIMNFAEDRTIAEGGKMHEGDVSTRLGLKGMPALAEEMMISRDLFLAEFHGGRIHFTTVSSAGSVDLIRKAKAKGLKVTAEVNSLNLIFDDQALESFDSNFKLKPPFRTAIDMDALRKGLADGTLDVICSDHTPQDHESKVKEFDHAAFGAINLETSFAAANTALADFLSIEEIIKKIAIAPRQILNLPVPSIAEQEVANVTLFNPDLEWTVSNSELKSRSRNCPLLGKKLRGKALGIYNKSRLYLS